MAPPHYGGLFKIALLQSVTEPDPVLAMLECVASQMMQIKAESKVGEPSYYCCVYPRMGSGAGQNGGLFEHWTGR
jgi:hypothetical protein